MKHFVLMLSLFGILLCVGCSNDGKGKHDIQYSLGKCIEVRVIPTSFNENPKVQVVTDEGFYIITGYHSYQRGEEVLVYGWQIYW